MRFAHIQNAVYRTPWNITAGGWLSIHEVLQSRMAADYKAGMFSDFINERPEMQIDGNNIAHIHVQGVLGKNLTHQLPRRRGDRQHRTRPARGAISASHRRMD